MAPKTTAESFWGSTWPPRRPPSCIFSKFGSILGLNLDPKTVPNPAKIDAKTRSLWHLLFGSIFGRFSVPTSTPWNPKSIDFPLVFQRFLKIRMLKLRSISDPILGRFWLHFGSQNRPKSVKNIISKSILFLIHFKVRFLTDFGPNEAQMRPQNGPQMGC